MRRAVCAVALVATVAGLAVHAPDARATSGWPVSWSPAGTWIAAAALPDYGTAVIIAPVGGGPVSYPSLYSTAEWSPDGRSIAGFTSNGSGVDSLRIVSAVDGTAHSIGLPFTNAESVSWAPGGGELAYASSSGISVARFDGSQQRELVHVGTLPAWSPGGGEIAFTRPSTSWWDCRGSISIVTSDGSAERMLVNGAGGTSQAVWSPDGSRLAYSDSCSQQAYVVNRDGSGNRVLGDARADTVAWSSDGRWVSASGYKSTTLFEVGGSRQVTFRTDGAYGWGSLHWSPVSDQVLFSRLEELGDVIVVGSVDGSQRVIGPGSYGDWSPDGTTIAVIHEMYRDSLPYASCADQLRIIDLQGTALAGLTPCRFEGTRGANTISGTVGPDVIVAGNGADRVSGGLGADRIFGGAGRDRLVGGPGRDTVYGGSGADRVFVRDGQPDHVYCAAGTDTVTADRVDVVSRDCERVQRG